MGGLSDLQRALLLLLLFVLLGFGLFLWSGNWSNFVDLGQETKEERKKIKDVWGKGIPSVEFWDKTITE